MKVDKSWSKYRQQNPFRRRKNEQIHQQIDETKLEEIKHEEIYELEWKDDTEQIHGFLQIMKMEIFPN